MNLTPLLGSSQLEPAIDGPEPLSPLAGNQSPAGSVLQHPPEDALVAAVLNDPTFIVAVRAQQPQPAAVAAVSVLKAHFNAFWATDRPQSADYPSAVASPTTALLAAHVSDLLGDDLQHGRRSGDHARDSKDFKTGDRVVVEGHNKRTSHEIVGRAASVVALPGNGWVTVQMLDTQEVLKLQQRYLSHAPPDKPAGPLLGDPVLAAHPAHLLDAFPDLPDNLDSFVGNGLDDLVLPDAQGLPAGNGMRPASAVPAAQLSMQASMQPPYLQLPQNRLGPSTAFRQPNGQARSGVQQQAAAQQPAGSSMAGVSTAAKLNQKVRDSLRKLRAAMIDLEDKVPWNAVRRTWRSKRAAWKRAARSAEAVPELAACMRELRAALATDEACAMHLGTHWEPSLATCVAGQGSPAALLTLWEELSGAVGSWLSTRSAPGVLAVTQVQANGGRAVQAMQDAARRSADALSQVPLEAILNHDLESLAAVRAFIERERRLVVARVGSLCSKGDSTTLGTSTPRPGGGVLGSCLLDGFDSGAETQPEGGSEVTDMCDSD